MKTKNKVKKGISLIVLVITIIVMIILAATIVISLSNAGIINKANNAVELTNLKQVQQIANLAWSEAYADNVREQGELEAAVMAALEANKVDKSKYNIGVTENGVIVTIKTEGGEENTSGIPTDWQASVSMVTSDGVPIPKGFVVSPYSGEGTKNAGLVIYALSEEEIEDGVTAIPSTETHQESLNNRNQFVWVPVDRTKFDETFIRQNFGYPGDVISDVIGGTDDEEYWEVTPDTASTASADYVSQKTKDEVIAMYASVEKYGGFYIARYEMGVDIGDGNSTGEYSTGEYSTNEYSTSEFSTGEGANNRIGVTMGAIPLNNVVWGTSMSNEEANMGAVTLSRNMYKSTNTNYGVVSTLTYGIQWDRTLAWWKELEPTFDLTNSTSFGNYSNTEILLTDFNEGAKYSDVSGVAYYSVTTKKENGDYWLLSTGAYKKAKIYNIYDMAGNLAEWTMEGYDTTYRTYRGGSFSLDLDREGYPLVNRSFNDPSLAFYSVSFRPSLYIK